MTHKVQDPGKSCQGLILGTILAFTGSTKEKPQKTSTSRIARPSNPIWTCESAGSFIIHNMKIGVEINSANDYFSMCRRISATEMLPTKLKQTKL